MNHDTLSPLANAYLQAIVAAQDVERTALHAVDVDGGGEQTLGLTLTADEIVDLAVTRGLAEILHIVTMPASRSTKIPLNFEGPNDGLDELLEPSTGPANALRAVARHKTAGLRHTQRTPYRSSTSATDPFTKIRGDL